MEEIGAKLQKELWGCPEVVEVAQFLWLFTSSATFQIEEFTLESFERGLCFPVASELMAQAHSVLLQETREIMRLRKNGLDVVRPFEWWTTELKNCVELWFLERRNLLENLRDLESHQGSSAIIDDKIQEHKREIDWLNELVRPLFAEGEFDDEDEDLDFDLFDTPEGYECLTPVLRLTLLRSLCLWRASGYPDLAVEEEMRQNEEEVLRQNPLGYDDEGCIYYFFPQFLQDCRVYREVPSDEEEERRREKLRKAAKAKRSERRKKASTEEQVEEDDESKPSKPQASGGAPKSSKREDVSDSQMDADDDSQDVKLENRKNQVENDDDDDDDHHVDEEKEKDETSPGSKRKRKSRSGSKRQAFPFDTIPLEFRRRSSRSRTQPIRFEKEVLEKEKEKARLRRERREKEKTEERKADKSPRSTKQSKGRRKKHAKKEDEEEEEETLVGQNPEPRCKKWQVVCTDIDGIRKLIETLKNRKKRANSYLIKELYNTLETLEEEAENIRKQKEREEKRRKIEAMPRKRSSRIAETEIRRIEREKEEQQFAEERARIEAEAAARRKEIARMKRLKEREERKRLERLASRSEKTDDSSQYQDSMVHQLEEGSVYSSQKQQGLPAQASDSDGMHTNTSGFNVQQDSALRNQSIMYNTSNGAFVDQNLNHANGTMPACHPGSMGNNFPASSSSSSTYVHEGTNGSVNDSTDTTAIKENNMNASTTTTPMPRMEETQSHLKIKLKPAHYGE